MSNRNASVRASVTQTLDAHPEKWLSSAYASADQHAEAAESTKCSSANAHAGNDMTGDPMVETERAMDMRASDEPVCSGDIGVQAVDLKAGPSFKKAFRLCKKFDDVVHRRAGKWRKMD